MTKIAYIYGSKVPKKEADNIQVINNVYSLKKNGLNIDLLLPKTFNNLFISDTNFINKVANFFSKNPNFLPIKTIFSCPFYYKNFGRIFHDPIAVIYSKIKGYDYIYTRDLIAVFWAKIFKQKIIFETYRRFNKEHPLLFKLFFLLIKKNLKACITHSELARQDLIAGGVNSAIIKSFHNGFDADDLIPELKIEEAKRLLNIDVNSFIATYTGKISIQKGLITLLELAKINSFCTFYLIGYSNAEAKKNISNYISSFNLKNVKLIDYLTNKNLIKYLFASDVLIIPPSKTALEYGRTVLPIKTFQYLAIGRAIIAPEQEDTKEVLVHMSNSLLVKDGSIEEASAYLKLIKTDPPLYNKLSENAKKSSQNYSWNRRAINIIDWFSKLPL